MGLFRKYVSQTRKPEGFLGKLMIRGMNGGHAKLADWGMSHLSGIHPSGIAELGCGGGRFLICNESDGMDKTSLRFEKIIDGMTCYTKEQLAAALESAGFSKVTADLHPNKPWLTVVAVK